MSHADRQRAGEAISAVQRAVAEIQDEAVALGMAIQIMMELLRTIDPAERPRIAEALARIASNNLSIEDPRPAAAG